MINNIEKETVKEVTALMKAMGGDEWCEAQTLDISAAIYGGMLIGFELVGAITDNPSEDIVLAQVDQFHKLIISTLKDMTQEMVNRNTATKN